jgi:hypothetical protein
MSSPHVMSCDFVLSLMSCKDLSQPLDLIFLSSPQWDCAGPPLHPSSTAASSEGSTISADRLLCQEGETPQSEGAGRATES